MVESDRARRTRKGDVELARGGRMHGVVLVPVLLQVPQRICNVHCERVVMGTLRIQLDAGHVEARAVVTYGGSTGT